MKRLLAILLLALVFAPTSARAGTVGIGAFGGANIPVVQDDNGQGTTFGIRVPVALLPLVTVEPYFGTTSDGDVTQTILGTSYTRSGFGISSFGANVLLTFGSHFQVYPFAGIGTNTLTRDGSADQTMMAFNAGLGFGISPAPKFRIHIRGQAERFTNGDAGRVFGNVTGGVSYSFLSFGTKK
jgi:hypothetical protein